MSLGVSIPGPNEKVNSLLMFPFVFHFTALILRLVYTSKHKSAWCLVKLKAFWRINLAMADNVPGSFNKLDFRENIASTTAVSTLFDD